MQQEAGATFLGGIKAYSLLNSSEHPKEEMQDTLVLNLFTVNRYTAFPVEANGKHIAIFRGIDTQRLRSSNG